MFSVGLLYLLFEKSMLPTSGNDGLVADGLSRSILGIQLGEIILAMLITRSSVAALQARRGLPLGNQVAGWMVLGRLPTDIPVPLLIRSSHFARHTISSWHATKQLLPPSTCGCLFNLFAHLHNPYHLIRRAVLFHVLSCPRDLGTIRTSHLHIYYPPPSITPFTQSLAQTP